MCELWKGLLMQCLEITVSKVKVLYIFLVNLTCLGLKKSNVTRTLNGYNLFPAPGPNIQILLGDTQD